MNYYRSFICFTLLINGILNAYCIDAPESRKVTLKAYNNARYEYFDHTIERIAVTPMGEDDLDYTFRYKNYQLSSISLAMEFDSDAFLNQEIEIMPIALNRGYTEMDMVYNTILETINIKATTIESYLRYQLTYSFANTWTLQPTLGISSMLFYSHGNFHQSSSDDIFNSLSYHSLGLQFDIVPGMKYSLNDRLAFDINIPFHTFSTWINEFYTHRPLPSSMANHKDKFEYSLFPTKYHLRLGIHYTL